MKFSRDLTLFLIHGNGAPRSLRLSLSKLRIQVIALVSVLLLLLVLSLVFSSIYVYERYISPTPLLTADKAKKLKEIGALEKIVAELQLELEKASLGGKNSASSPLQLIAPTTGAVHPSPIAIEGLSATQEKNKISLSFKLKNALSTQEKASGYILALLRTKDSIRSYPEGILRPKGKVILPYNKGKYFSIVRFVDMQIHFENIAKESIAVENTTSKEDISLELLIFSPTGKLLYSSHVEELGSKV